MIEVNESEWDVPRVMVVDVGDGKWRWGYCDRGVLDCSHDLRTHNSTRKLRNVNPVGLSEKDGV